MRWCELSTLRLVAIALTVVLVFGPARSDAQDAPMRLSLEEGRSFAETLLEQGQASAAREIVLALLQANPRDVQALILLAQIDGARGDFASAQSAARAAWQAATTQNDRFIAAVTRAQIHARADRLTMAQYWLRRAAELAPNPTAAALVAQDFARVRNANPLSVTVGADIQPSSNVNNGSANATTTFVGLPFVFELSPEARALSGGTVSLSVNLRYAVSRSENRVTFLTVDGTSRLVWLSSDALASAPDANAPDYSYAALGVGVNHRWRPAGGNEPYSLSLRAEQAWFGGDAYSSGVTLALSRDFVLSETDRLSVTGSLGRSHYNRSNEVALPAMISLNWAHAMANGDVLSAGASLTKTYSDVATRRYEAAVVSFGYDFGEIFQGFDMSGRVSQEWRGYDSAFLGPNLREDRRTTASVSVGTTKIDLFGFQPVLTIEAVRNDSNVDLYETDSINTGLSFRTSF